MYRLDHIKILVEYNLGVIILCLLNDVECTACCSLRTASSDTQELHTYSASPHYGLTISNDLEEESPTKLQMAAEFGATDHSSRPVPPLPIKSIAECDSTESLPLSNDYEPVGGFAKLSASGGANEHFNVSASDDESIHKNGGGETQP